MLTDPSYRGQIVAMTAPEIGNVGINPTDFESSRPWCAGFVVRELSPVVSSWRASGSLHELLAGNGVAGIDRRRHPGGHRRIRAFGRAAGGDHPRRRPIRPPPVAARAQSPLARRARSGPRGHLRDALRMGRAALAGPRAPVAARWWSRRRHHVVAYDYGIKRKSCASSVVGVQVSVVPATTPAREALAMKPDGIFLSNGPGDPAAVDYAVEAAARCSAPARFPLFGICLGHQILGLALGGKTYKLKFGHHGANHPVMDLGTRKVEITSQNHGFAVDVDSLAGKAELSHVSLNDKTVEGMRHATLPVFSVQYHPEASPGPNDAGYLFDRFRVAMEERRRR